MSLNVWAQPSGTSLGIFPEENAVDIPLPVVGAATVIVPEAGQSSIANGSFANLPPVPLTNYLIPNSDIIVNITWQTNGPSYYAPIITVVNGGVEHTPGGEFDGGDRLVIPFSDMNIVSGGDWTWYIVSIGGVTYKVISGALPGGLRINGSHIVGNPYIVANNTTSSFCIRATDGISITDHTFFITITGLNEPKFITAAGDLPIGPAKQLYVLDQSLVSYQIEAFDLNVAVGQTLTYFIGNDDGKLPKGLTLSPSGLISGFIEPVVKITPEDGSGTYDESFFDAVAYDFANLPTDGFDSYLYDDVFYDYNMTTAPPTTLNANYKFRVTITDGVNFAQRIFNIFVIGTDQFRADNTAFNGVASGFSADATYLRSPVWLTNANLGVYRANNYLTIPIALYDTIDVLFRLERTNEEVYALSSKVLATDNVVSQSLLGTLTSNSNVITNVANANRYTVGQLITGKNIPTNSVINSVTTTTITISKTIGQLPINNILITEITSLGGTFFCLKLNSVLIPGQTITITGANTGTGGISGYTSGNVYYVIGIPTLTSFQLSATFGGSPISTSIGSPTGLTVIASVTVQLNYGGNQITVSNVKGTIEKGQYLTFDNYLEGADETVYEVEDVTPLINNQYRITLCTAGTVTLTDGFVQQLVPLKINIPNGTPFYIGSLSKLPPGVKFDIASGNIYGKIPYQPNVTKNFEFTITGTRLGDNIKEYLNSSKTFNITLLGDVNSEIMWDTQNNLGTIPAGYVSTLSVIAKSKVPDAVVTYNLVSGTLPPGLRLSSDGEILGTLNQYTTPIKSGVTIFDGGLLTFDDNTTSIDRTFKFTIQASDQFNYSAINRDFTVSVSTPNTVPYSNIVTKPYLKSSQRSMWYDFINDPGVFTPSSIYRPNDINFGIQSSLTMLVYAGIETEVASAYIGAMGLNFKKKRFQFGNVEKATAVDPVTGESIYEVVYVQMIDPLEVNGKHLPTKITNNLGTESDRISVDNSTIFYDATISELSINVPFDRRNTPMVTVDSTGYEVSNPNPNEYFPNSITNWQNRLSNTVASLDANGNVISTVLLERNYLPLWMRSVPPGQKQQRGYTLSVPLCFCKPGTADTIILNIKYSGFEFNTIDYQIDRFIIDSVTGYQGDKYLVFKNDRITVG